MGFPGRWGHRGEAVKCKVKKLFLEVRSIDASQVALPWPRNAD